MRLSRLWLLVLLAALLPFRGALAMAMQCPGMGSSLPAQAQPADHHAGHHGTGGHADHAHHGDAAPEAQDQAGHEHGPADKCNLCSVSCCATGIVSTPLVLQGPQATSTVFPQPTAPSWGIVPHRQERPPRTT